MRRLFLILSLGFCTCALNGQEIVQLEYYFDVDPGYGNANELSFTPDSMITLDTMLSLAILPEGIHTLYLRARDTLGNWSFIQKRSFIKDPYATGAPSNITAVEFFVDEDPGYGSGVSQTIEDSTSIDIDTIIDLTGMTRGIHTQYVRVKNAANYWSFVTKRSFLFDDERVEYVQFKFDSIPAYADWTVSNPFDPDFDILADIDFEGICDLDTGWYYIDARARRELSWWSKEHRDSIEIKDEYLQTGLIADQFGDSIPLADILVDGVSNFMSDSSGHYSFLVPKCWGDTISLERDSIYSSKKSYLFQNPVFDYSAHHILGDIDSTLYGYKCINESGSIPLNQAYVCENTSLQVTKSGEVIDTGSISGYILHDGQYTLGTMHAANLTGIFLNDGSLPQNQKLYISPVVGRPGDPDLIDVDHVCTDILLPGKPVVFLNIRDSIFIQLDSVGIFNVSPDTLLESNCSTCDIVTYGLSQSLFECADHGFNLEMLTVDDGSGNIAVCPLTISVRDILVPTMTCITDTLVHTDMGQCDYTGIDGLLDPDPTWDNCPITLTNNFSGTGSLNGIDLPLGVHLILWTIDDAHGNTASCIFEATVEDHEAPVIVCTPDATRSTDPGLCTYVVKNNEFDPIVTDNCTAFSYWNDSTNTNSLDGLTLALGSHLVTWYVDDGHGQFDTCERTITVEDNEAPEITCTSSATRSTDTGLCTYTIDGTEFDPISVSDNCDALTFYNDSSHTATLDGLTLEIGDHVFTWTADDGHGQATSCTLTVTVEDNESPIITCAGNATRNTDPGVCTYDVVGSEFDPVTVDDNCIGYTYFNDSSFTSTLSGVALNLGSNVITWTVDDQHGQSASCTMVVTIEDDTPPIIICSDNATRNTDPGECTYIVNGSAFDPVVVDDNCSAFTYMNDSSLTSTLSGVVLALGSNIIIWTVDDQHGNTASCSVTITIADVEFPEITCASDTVVHTDAGVCTYTVDNSSFDPVLVDDNCDAYTFHNQLTGLSSLAGAVLDTGMHVVVWTVDDQQGNTTSCSMTITVEDHQAPVITCPGNGTQNADPGICSYTIIGTEYDPVLVNDNCSDYFFFNNLNASSTLDDYILPVGNHTIVWTVDDDHGQTASCSVSVMVEDNQAPSISCPSNQIRLAAFGTCSYTTDGTEFDPVTVSDNCDDYFTYNNINFSSSLGGQVLNVGSHNITWVVNDGHGQIQNCAFTVNIIDVQPPSIDCPDDVTLEIPSTFCDTVFQYTALTADNCPGEEWSVLSGIGSGNAFPLGVSQEVLEVEDMSGNTASCAFTVTVNSIPDMVNDTICYGDSIYLEGVYQYLPGVYTDTLQNTLACDSIVITTLDTTTYCIWPSEIIYVDSSASGDNTGVDWENAYLDLQLALDVASRYFNADQIWVAKGTYFPTEGSNRGIPFILSDSTIVLGGFQGVESDSSERDVVLYPVVLSGDIGVQNDVTDNSYHIVVNPGANAAVRLDGVTIKHGNADGVDSEDQSGAGLTNLGIMHFVRSRIVECTGIGLGTLIYNSGLNANLTLENITLLGTTPDYIWNEDQAILTGRGTLEVKTE